jgi:peptidyl-tRNA hydrolase
MQPNANGSTGDRAAPESSPWALQLAARIEKRSPPTTAAVAAAAALATIRLLDDPRSRPGGLWHDAVTTWNGKRIRKLVRRARASAWDRAQTVAGVTVERNGAEVRAFVPSPMDQAPREVTKLQIRSTPLDDITPIPELPDIEPGTLVIAITPYFDMTWGKQAAQAAHAGQRAWMTADAGTVLAWKRAGEPIAVLHPAEQLWHGLDDVATTRIHDGGFTEIPPGTNSALAWFASPRPTQITP